MGDLPKTGAHLLLTVAKEILTSIQRNVLTTPEHKAVVRGDASGLTQGHLVNDPCLNSQYFSQIRNPKIGSRCPSERRTIQHIRTYTATTTETQK